MTRAVIAGALLAVVLAAGFTVGVIRTLTDEDWPDW